MDNETRDGMTNLLNHSEIHRIIREEVSGEGEGKKINRYTIGLIDIDYYSKCNETYGHKFGDRVLKEVADCITANLEDRGIPARVGGDEFLIYFREMPFEETFIIMESIRREVKDLTILPDNGKNSEPFRCTLSIGIASYPTNGKDVHEVMRLADEALYRAKLEGRDRICIAIEEKKVPKTVYYTKRQVERVNNLSRQLNRLEADLYREGVDLLLNRYEPDMKCRG